MIVTPHAAADAAAVTATVTVLRKTATSTEESRVGRRAEAEVVRWLRVRWGGGWEVRVTMDRPGGVGLLVVRGPRGREGILRGF